MSKYGRLNQAEVSFESTIYFGRTTTVSPALNTTVLVRGLKSRLPSRYRCHDASVSQINPGSRWQRHLKAWPSPVGTTAATYGDASALGG